MRSVILYIAMSLDGYIADAKGDVGWLSGDGSAPDASGSYLEFFETVDTVILGWNTYHQIVTELSPDEWPYKGKESYVLTHREKDDVGEIHFVSGDMVELLRILQDQPGKDIWICGGAEIAQQFIKAGRIDRFHLTVIPTVLGKGGRLFPVLQSEMPLKLIKTASYNGMVDLIYVKR